MLPSRKLAGVAGIVLAIAAAKLALHLYTSHSYGYFVDELYYLACSRHLAWGYVDQPPLIAFITRIGIVIFGDSLAAIRFFPAVAGAIRVLLTGLLAREMGGGRMAQGLAALGVFLAPGFLGMDNLMTMNSYEGVIWTAAAWLVARIVNTGNQKLWIWFGVLAGVGLENKHSMLLFGAGLVVGLVLTPQRKAFRAPWIWIAGVIAFLIFLPNLLWNIQHHFPFLELQRNIKADGRDVRLSMLSFWGQEGFAMLPASLPLWIAGLWFCFRSPAGKPYRILGWAWLVVAGLVLALSPRIYYVWPAFPILFAAGGVACESGLSRPRLRWARYVWPAIMVVMSALLAPLLLPLLPVDTYLRYTETLHIQQPRIENRKLGPLPQLFADQFGWPEMVQRVAEAFHKLPIEVQERTGIYAQDYGSAGAIDLFGPRYGLPHAISGHQSYFLWGPGGYTGESMIVLNHDDEKMKEQFESVEQVGAIDHPYSMPSQHYNIYYCRRLKVPLAELWPQLKHWR